MGLDEIVAKWRESAGHPWIAEQRERPRLGRAETTVDQALIGCFGTTFRVFRLRAVPANRAPGDSGGHGGRIFAAAQNSLPYHSAEARAAEGTGSGGGAQAAVPQQDVQMARRG